MCGALYGPVSEGRDFVESERLGQMTQIERALRGYKRMCWSWQ